MILHDCPKCGSSRIAWSTDTFGGVLCKSRAWCTACDHAVSWMGYKDIVDVEKKVAELWNGGI